MTPNQYKQTLLDTIDGLKNQLKSITSFIESNVDTLMISSDTKIKMSEKGLFIMISLETEDQWMKWISKHKGPYVMLQDFQPQILLDETNEIPIIIVLGNLIAVGSDLLKPLEPEIDNDTQQTNHL